MKSRVVDKGKLSPIEEISRFLNENADGWSGAIMFFIGKVKRKSKDEKDVDKIEIESYREGSNEKLVEISEKIKKKYDLRNILIVHGEGVFYPGEDLVVVGVASKGRKEAIKAIQEVIEAYKKKAFLFKKEIYKDGTGRWITE